MPPFSLLSMRPPVPPARWRAVAGGLLLTSGALSAQAQCTLSFPTSSGSQVSNLTAASQPITPGCSGRLTTAVLSTSAFSTSYTAEVRTADCGGGTLLATSSSAEYDINGQTTFTFATPATLTASTTYYVYYRFTGANTAAFFASGPGNSSYTPQFSNCQSYPANLVGRYTLAAAVAPTLSSLSPTSGPVGTSVTLTGTGFTSGSTVSFNGTAATSVTYTSATSLTAVVPTGATTGNVTVTSTGGTSGGVAFTVTYPSLTINTPGQTIAAGTYNSITVNAGGSATLTGAVTVNSSVTVNFSGTLLTNCQPLTGAASFTLAGGGTLGICDPAGISSSGATGAVQTTGTRSFATDASYLYNGTAAQVTGNALPAQVLNLTTTNANAVTLSQGVRVNQVLTIGGAGNLVLGGQALLLPSTFSGTALVVNSGTGVVSGATATVQRYIGNNTAGNGYRHYSAPVQGETMSTLATTGYTPDFSGGAAYNASATPGSVRPFPTVYGYDETRVTLANNLAVFDKGWHATEAGTEPMTVGRGYSVNAPGSALVDFTGTPTTGPVTLTNLTRTNADGGWQLLGNPYPAPLDWSTMTLGTGGNLQNMDAAAYVFHSSGPYAGSYSSYVTSAPAANRTTAPLAASASLISAGSGFFVRTTTPGTAGTVRFTNANRGTVFNGEPSFGRTTADPRPVLLLELAGTTSGADPLLAYADASATPAFDPAHDAAKLSNPSGLNLSSLAPNGEALAIDARPAFTAATVLPLAVGVPTAGTYTLTTEALNNLPAGLTAYLRDAQTGQTVALSAGSRYSFQVSATEATALVLGRFTVQFTAAAPLAATPAALAAQVLLYPNPAREQVRVVLPGVAGASSVQAELLNSLGQVVRRQPAALPASGTTLTLATEGLAPGVYVLRLSAGTTTVSKRLVVE